MLSHQEEVLRFLNEFEITSREYLRSKGVGEHDVANAHLELQWQFLHTILQKHPLRPRRSAGRSAQNFTPRKKRATIA
ncbi:MAG: hypothetical protein QMC95_10545 [Desulfitobacteriaceae bacterium]|nr:hypothetical protein [Desulfitobacteriaceae bacterium]MDI6878518.1 hypothetical protein [Desulfitobacteriaceae bacterium]MDI6914648.1 hypothetical protein [Desulfitobacteriaceae bacterium]